MSPDKTIKEALRTAQKALAAHIEPGGPDCPSTITRLLDVLDSREVYRAMKKSDAEEARTTRDAS